MGIVVNRTRLNPFPVKSASGGFISIDDAVNRPVKKLEISFTPQQDLHGYDYPWVGGANKNKFDTDNANWKNGYYLDASGVEQSSTAYKYTQAFTPVLSSTQYAIQMNKTVSTQAGLTVCEYDENQTFIQRTVAVSSTITTGVFSGTFTTTATTKYIRFSAPYGSSASESGSYHFQLETGSSATAWSPYSNICPIFGLSGVKINKDDSIVFPTDTAIGQGTINGTTGVIQPSAVRIRCSYFPIEPNTTYTAYSNLPYIGARFYTTNQQDAIIPDESISLTEESITFTTGSTTGYARLIFAKALPASGSGSVAVEPSDLEYVNIISERGEIIPIDWTSTAGVIYGGSLDVSSGVLTANWKLVTFDGTESWASYSSGTKRYFRHELGAYEKVVVSGQGLCNIYPWYAITGTNTGVGFRVISSSSFNADLINIRPDNVDGMTATIFKEMLADWYANGTPCTVAYKMKNPVTYQLSAHQISTLMGSNRIWTDIGTISLDYRAMRSAQNTPLLGGMLGNPSVPEGTEEEPIDDEPIESEVDE